MIQSVWLVIGAVAIFIALAFGPLPEAKAQQPAPPAVNQDFNGKTLVVGTLRPPGVTALMILSDVQIKTLGNVTLLTGKVLYHSGAVIGGSAVAEVEKGSKVWVPMPDVDKIVEYSTLEECKKSKFGEYLR